MKYLELKSKEPVLEECFFAFSKEQFEEGKKPLGEEKIYSGGAGLYGTKEGLIKLRNYYDELANEIAEQCSPQDVYNYEYDNHECEYVCDDREAIEIVIYYFGKERAEEVSRRWGYTKIREL